MDGIKVVQRFVGPLVSAQSFFHNTWLVWSLFLVSYILSAVVLLALHLEPRGTSEEAEMVWWPWWLPRAALVVVMVGLIQV